MSKTFLAMHGNLAGGETGINDDILREGFANVGVSILGRNRYGPVRGPWGSDPWKGW